MCWCAVKKLLTHGSFCGLSTHAHTHLTALFPGLPELAGTIKVKPNWILLKQETVSGSGISWAICKSAPCSRQTTTTEPHHSVFYRPDALPAAQPTVSKHWATDLKSVFHKLNNFKSFSNSNFVFQAEMTIETVNFTNSAIWQLSFL